MSAQPKRDNRHPVEHDHAAPPLAEAPIDSGATTTSPARALQDQLRRKLSRRIERLSPRSVTAMLIVFCFAVWWALYVLVSSMARTFL